MVSELRFLFDGGDGDQSVFGQKFSAVRAEEPWFKPIPSEKDSLLLKIVSGANMGKFLVVESRLVETLASQLSHRRYPSLVVYLISQPGPNYLDDMIAVGMAAPEVVTNP